VGQHQLRVELDFSRSFFLDSVPSTLYHYALASRATFARAASASLVESMNSSGRMIWKIRFDYGAGWPPGLAARPVAVDLKVRDGLFCQLQPRLVLSSILRLVSVRSAECTVAASPDSVACNTAAASGCIALQDVESCASSASFFSASAKVAANSLHPFRRISCHRRTLIVFLLGLTLSAAVCLALIPCPSFYLAPDLAVERGPRHDGNRALRNQIVIR